MQSLLLVSVAILLAGCATLSGLRGVPSLPEEVSKAGERLRANDTRGAMEQFDLAVKRNPYDPETYRAILAVCSDRGRTDLIAHYAEQGAASLPSADVEDRVLLYRVGGDAYLKTGDPTKGIVLNEAAYKLAPESAEVMNDLGYAYAEMLDATTPAATRKLQGALQLTTKALEKARESGQSSPAEIGNTLDSVGWVQYKLHHYKDAIANLTRAVYLSPDQAEIHYHLGMAYEKNERYSEAAVELKRARKIDPDYKPAIDELDSLARLLPVERPVEREDSPPDAPSTPDAPSASPRR